MAVLSGDAPPPASSSCAASPPASSSCAAPPPASPSGEASPAAFPSGAASPMASSASRFSMFYQVALCFVKGYWDYLTTKEYERNAKTKEQLEAIKKVRLREYLIFCAVGMCSMHCGGGVKVLEHMKNILPKEAFYCVIYLTYAHWSMVMGLIASSFSSYFPWASMFFAGYGAWQSGVFVLAVFHSGIGAWHADYSMIAASSILTLYWAYAVQDPLPLHSAGKVVMTVLVFLRNSIYWIVPIISKAFVFVFSFPLTAISWLWTRSQVMRSSYTNFHLALTFTLFNFLIPLVTFLIVNTGELIRLIIQLIMQVTLMPIPLVELGPVGGNGTRGDI